MSIKSTTPRNKLKSTTASRTKISATSPESTIPPQLASLVQKPSQAAISRRAHDIWLSEGQPEGKADIHWFQAEQELRKNMSITSK